MFFSQSKCIENPHFNSFLKVVKLADAFFLYFVWLDEGLAEYWVCRGWEEIDEYPCIINWKLEWTIAWTVKAVETYSNYSKNDPVGAEVGRGLSFSHHSFMRVQDQHGERLTEKSWCIRSF